MARKNQGRGPKQQIRDAERRAEALKLRKEGLTYDQIAQRMGFAFRTAAQQLVKRALEELWQEPARDLVEQECAKCDEHERAAEMLILGNLESAAAGDEERARIVLGAMGRAATVRDQRAKYLGLVAKEKPEPPQPVAMRIELVTAEPDAQRPA